MSGDAPRQDIVLVVDDNRDELRLLIEALEQGGITALAARSGEEALAVLAHATPDMVVLDAVMSGLDGFETCRRIKRQSRFAHVPVIFLTGLKETQHVLEGLSAGGVDYVAKPVIIEELVARIRIHIANARAAFGAHVALDAVGRHLIATDTDGRPLWCTPQAASLLSSIFGPLENLRADFPADACAAFLRALGRGQRDAAFEIGRGSQKIAAFYLCENGPGEILFRLTEPAADSEEHRLRKGFALTDREAEVLLWIARGKSNQDIAEILAISPRTVHKHLERVFAKLGVENRSAAAAVAVAALHDGH